MRLVPASILSAENLLQ